MCIADEDILVYELLSLLATPTEQITIGKELSIYLAFGRDIDRTIACPINLHNMYTSILKDLRRLLSEKKNSEKETFLQMMRLASVRLQHCAEEAAKQQNHPLKQACIDLKAKIHNCLLFFDDPYKNTYLRELYEATQNDDTVKGFGI